MWIRTICLLFALVLATNALPKNCEWKVYKGKYIGANNNEIIRSISLELCKQNCINAKGYDCASIDYDTEKSHCHLSSVTYEQAHARTLMRTAPEYDLHVCVPTLKGATCDWKITDGTYIAMNNNKKYYAISLEACQEMCQMQTDFKCNSFDYNTKRNICFLSTMTKKQADEKFLIRKNIDFKMVECQEQACEWKVYNGKYIGANNNQVIRDLTLAVCMDYCKNANGYKCTSIDYDTKGSHCHLSNVTYEKAMERNLLRTDAKFDLHVCVPKQACEWKVYNGKYIGANNNEVIRDLTLAVCMDHCKNANGYKCSSIDYDTKGSHCHLSNVTYEKAMERNLLRTDAKFDLHVCVPKLTGAKCDWVVSDGSYIAMNTNKKYYSVSLEQCQDLCEKATDFKCNTIDYYVKKGTCFLSVITKKEATEKFLIRSHKDFKLVECHEKADKGSGWKHYKGTYIAMYNYINIPHTPLETCKKYCEQDTVNKCVSFDYDTLGSRCLLSKMSVTEAKEKSLIRSSNRFDLYERLD